MNLIESKATSLLIADSPITVGIIGGGIAGSTIALRLAEQGINVQLFEEGKSLVNGPPICHLHAGGNLYREISDQQCITLLKQSIDTLRVYQHTSNIRPTVIAIPCSDAGNPDDLLPRLTLLQQTYQALVADDAKNCVLGNPKDYFKLYQRSDLERLALHDNPQQPLTPDQWMIPVAKSINLDQFKYPLVMVQEYGLSVFRIAATLALALQRLPHCHVNTNTKVTSLAELPNGWQVSYQDATNHQQQINVDYLVNAGGYRTGTIDDLAHIPRQRMVEFKAAYVTHWPQCDAQWPEVIFHGERGTPNGMAQLTPYPDGFFQLHGMTQDITLFKNGLVASNGNSAQPQLDASFKEKLQQHWTQQEIEQRTQRAINHMAQFVNHFDQATVGGKPLFGAQQIPGNDPTLRAADVSYSHQRYARSEIVKASSALSVADAIIEQLAALDLIQSPLPQTRENAFPVAQQLSLNEIVSYAEKLAAERGFPTSLARPIGH
ncbi:bifunctional tRNA (mnm(5)s(2)U34)-methyltransferase/FAD-dependent cmnm(5)s(2)U34 oxidoreductase [Photobacterium malacitanum]|uniref:Bifunctional tRNA (Mnm(5)s(2)U34)-methyltransferase/FAD-dependent cmnm(5)s(2)U34 oxidoreductase n=1 Tax=Photobacterium malacitanum TaxID=2204294 RepID=A0A1Y6MC73_9GAMM|nr:FAD-dependent oxidoreductase [Photobacterium malacitanum]SMY34102.1 bifunctional tRNA (mnm(5)s(2)U34)-methyltransferase/FAD-dependent cmnm(5)s(2)U34 oxidoreductase [Photobacterium malacitanum]